MVNMELLEAQLAIDEGVRLKPYVDTAGKITAGIGHNMSDSLLSMDLVQKWLKEDIQTSIEDLDKYLPWWRSMTEPRQRVLINMCFNMGIGNEKKGLLSFKNTLNYMKNRDYEKASQGMLASKWADQVHDRAKRLAKIMRNG